MQEKGAPVVPPGWEGAADRLIRIVDPSGEAIAWLVGDAGANCIAYAVRRCGGWVHVLDPGSPQALAERPTRFGCPVLFLSGAAGSTHNTSLSCDEMVIRLKSAVREGLARALPMSSARLAARRREFDYEVRRFDEAA